MLTILPLTYFGSIGYFNAFRAPEIIIDIHEHYIKQTARSRCEILSANGRMYLSVPVSKPYGSRTAMKDILISYATDWQRLHWKALESAYASTPYFEDYAFEIKKLIYSNHEKLIELNKMSLLLIDHWLDLNLHFEMSSKFVEDANVCDLRNDNFNQQLEKTYYQQFTSTNEFENNLSILDLLFAEGPMARKWIVS
jgi:hypothetical protein